MIPSISASSVFQFALFKLHEGVLSKASSITLTIKIWYSQTPPIFEAAGRFST